MKNMNDKSFGFDVMVLLAVVLGTVTASAMPSVESFATPMGAARANTGPLFWMHGTESVERLREYVGRVDESGQGILTAESRPHNDWLGPGWWRDLRIVIDEAKRRGLKVMLYDDYWYPSQYMGENIRFPTSSCVGMSPRRSMRGDRPPYPSQTRSSARMRERPRRGRTSSRRTARRPSSIRGSCLPRKAINGDINSIR